MPDGNSIFNNITRIGLALSATIATCLLVEIPAASALDDDLRSGQKIYVAQCASCHGDKGQGHPDHYDEKLTGDLAVSELAELISDTMPEEDPDKCVAKEALLVAKYVHEKFYSEAAQRRNNKARVELAHLTVRQYRESVADLVGSFGKPTKVPNKRGLKAEYFASTYLTRDKKISTQTDANIDFAKGVQHFRADGKYKGIKQDKNRRDKRGLGFSASWNGGIIAPETGQYHFRVQSKNGFKLYINDPETPLIDRWVSSGKGYNHTAKVHLLAGRIYTIKLEMFAFEEKSATMRLLWKTPHGILTPVPPDVFVDFGTNEVAVVSNRFPPDDASSGFKRGVGVSRGWDDATTTAALETATWISDRIFDLARTRKTDVKSREKVRAFCVKFVELAFVSNLSDQEKKFFVHQHFTDNLSINDSVKRVVLLALKSPRFLYPQLQKRNKNFERARRLSLFFWDSLPDKQLFQLAAGRKLFNVKNPNSNNKHLNRQLKRMLIDPRSKQKLRDFFHFWLKTEEAAEATKDEQRFPEFNKEIVFDLRNSLDLFLDHVIWSEKSDFRDLFLADYLFVNQRLANYYQLEAKQEEFSRVGVDPKERAGILTHPYLMSGLAYHTESSPIHRGVFVTRNLLGRSLKQPVAAVSPLTEAFDPKMTTRERVEHQTREVACMACHSIINPLGFSLEHYDAVGRFRTKDKKKPIDVTSVYKTPDGEAVKLAGARQLAEFIADNEMAQKSFVRQLFHYYVNQPINAFDSKAKGQPNQLDRLHQKFKQNNFNVQSLLIEMAKVVIDGPPEN